MHTTLNGSCGSFAKELREATGINVYDCYQCGKCTAGCAVAGFMDDGPARVMRLAQLGMRQEALASRGPWLCAACNTCSQRCPMQLEVAKVMEAVRIAAAEEAPEPEVALFAKLFLGSVQRHGRLFELGMTASFNIASGALFKDAAIGAALAKHGKLAPLPQNAPAKKTVKQIFDKTTNQGDKQ